MWEVEAVREVLNLYLRGGLKNCQIWMVMAFRSPVFRQQVLVSRESRAALFFRSPSVQNLPRFRSPIRRGTISSRCTFFGTRTGWYFTAQSALNMANVEGEGGAAWETA